MDTLTELAIKYGTDKWGKHHYTPVYYEMFEKNRDEVQAVLEIGSAEGAGLRMFRDFFPNAVVYGAEIEDKRIFEDGRIKVIKYDQTRFENREKLIAEIFSSPKRLDLIVDDGSHKTSDQFFACLSLIDRLDSHGVYVIEDVSEPELAELLEKHLPEKKVRCLKVGDRYDDRLIVITNE